MNRREVMTALTAMCGAARLDASVDAVASERPATLAIIHLESRLSEAGIAALHESWNRVRKIAPDLPPCIVMLKGMRLELRTEEQ